MKYTKTKRIAVIGVLLLAVLIIFRETGLLAVNNYKVQLQGNSSSKRSTTLTKYYKQADTTITGQTVQAKTYGFYERNLANILTAEFKSQGINADATVQILEWSLGGYYFLPLSKSGNLTYNVEVKCDAQRLPAATSTTGTFSGTLSVKVEGLCSFHEFQSILQREVAEKIVESINADLNTKMPDHETTPPSP